MRLLLSFLLIAPSALAQGSARSLVEANRSAAAAAEAARAGNLRGAAFLGAAAFETPVALPAPVLVPAPAVQAAPAAPALQAAPVRAAAAPAAPAQNPAPAAKAPNGPLTGGHLGLRPESDYDLTTGRDAAANAPREGKWYFLDDAIAVPKEGTPSLVWIGSRDTLMGAKISDDGKTVRLADGTEMAFALTPKIAENKSYWNDASAKFFAGRTVRLRGEIAVIGGVKTFVARTVWPEDMRLDAGTLTNEPAKSDEDILRLVKADEGGTDAPFQAKVLWERNPGARDYAGKAVMGVMLNGSQGDDDDAHAGHFSLFTGRWAADGSMADWLYSNYYDLDLVSEKGIIPALVPMDKYMGDLNSGQSWYRPTHILVAVMKDDALAKRVQARQEEQYAKFYAHEVNYHRTVKPCASLIIDLLRADGWNIPERGPSNLISSVAIGLLTGIGSLSPASGRDVYDFMRQERTRLFPRAAFEAMGGDLLRLGRGETGRELTPFERELAENLEAVIMVRVPQFPSSRDGGSYAIGSAEEYFGRVPLRRSKWKTTPNAPRPFPPPGVNP